LKGAEGGWKANFDWLIKESNLLKVLEDNYIDKPKRYGRKEIVPSWANNAERELDEAELEAIRKMMSCTPEEFLGIDVAEQNTVGNNPELAERAERLRQQLQGD